jgi:putative aldouronate transport system substrate-binding protein
MKKMIFIILMTMFVAGFVFANGSSEAGSESAPKEPVELSWYFIGSYPQSDQQTVYEEFNRILLERYNLTIDFKPVGWGEFDQKMQVMIAAGEEFDITYTANWVNNYSQNVAKGAFVPLDDLLPEYAPTLYKSLPDAGWNAVKIAGSIYATINQQIATHMHAIAFPQSLVEKYNFDINSIKRLEDLEPYLAALKANEKGVIPFGAFNEPGTLTSYVKEYLGYEEVSGGAVPGAISTKGTNTTIFNQFASQEFKDWIYLMRDWYKKGYIKDDALAITDMNPNLSGGGVGASMMGNYAPGAEIDTAARWGYPVVIAKLTKPYMMTKNFRGTMYGISATSKHPVEAVKFLEILNTDKELYNMICYGIEGVHYNKAEGEYIDLIADSGYNPSTTWAFGEVFNAYLLTGQPEDVWQQTRDMNLTAESSPIMGFSFDPSSVQSEIAQCVSVRQEFLPALELGVADPDEMLPVFLEKLELAGAQTIIDETQRQLDAWLAAR